MLIDSLLTPIVESTYLNITHACMGENHWPSLQCFTVRQCLNFQVERMRLYFLSWPYLANIVNLQYEKEIIAIAQEPVARTPKKTEGYRVVAPWLMGRPNRYHKLGSDQVLRVRGKELPHDQRSRVGSQPVSLGGSGAQKIRNMRMAQEV